MNTAPTANAGVDFTLAQGSTGQLDGSGSVDAETALSFSWAQASGTAVTLSDSAAATPSFTAPQRFLGNETLVFELTTTDVFGVRSTDAVDVTIAGSLPAVFYIVDEETNGVGVGQDIDGGAKVTLNTDGTGVFLDDTGSQGFNYSVSGNVVSLVFPAPILVDDFEDFFDVDGDGAFDDFFLVEERASQFELTLVNDLVNGDALSFREIGTRSFTPITADDTKAPEAYEFNDPLTAYDPAQIAPFAFVDGAERTLMFNAFPVINTLGDPERLYQDIFVFNSNGTGRTANTAIDFTYVNNQDGSLNVSFANGESAKYLNLTTRASGDVVVAEYTLNAPLHPDDDAFIADISLSLPLNVAAPVPTSRGDVAGIYTGSIRNPDLDDAKVFVRLNPDGTGSVQLDFLTSNGGSFNFEEKIVVRSSFGVCWDVDTLGEIEVNRIFSPNIFPNTSSAETTPAFCAAQTPESTDFQFILRQFDNDGTTFKHFDRSTNNRCFGPGPCTLDPILDVTNFQLRIATREAFNATPPVSALDRAQPRDATSITVDVLANDIARDLAIDPSTVTIVTGPFFGTATVNPTTGAITYTPNPGITQDLIQYFVRDTGGNQSQVSDVEVVINPCAEINGQLGSFERFRSDCDYTGLTGAANVVTTDVNLGPLDNGGAHLFDGSLLIGQDFSSNSGLATAGITQGGDGPTLNIAAGTILAFRNPTDIISVRRGSRINIAGTSVAPVIMASEFDVFDQRNVAQGFPSNQSVDLGGQWGGLVIHGFGVTNACDYTGAFSSADLAVSGECHVPSDSGTGTYGGQNNADSSGSISYLQIKRAGGFVNGDPAGAFALYGVGSGTGISHVETYAVDGDGIGLIGGAPDIQNYLGLYTRRASIAIDEGYRGNVANALLIQAKFFGRECVAASGIVDANLLSPAQVDGLITQGLNSRVNLQNLTCVVSAPFSDTGRGVNFFNAAFGTLTDSIVIVPGQDALNDLGYCIGSENRSLQAVQDGDVSITSNIFACPDRTDGEILPNTTPLDTFLSSAGNQFATLPTGVTNLPPVLGTSNVLLEGAPLIYSVPQPNLQVDGSPTTVAPTGSFIGAVQQGANDWTIGWTFGLHPDARLESLWYDGPILPTQTSFVHNKGDLVTLDASTTIAVANPITFAWSQIQGPPVILSDPTGSSPTFIAPGAEIPGVTPDEFYLFELVATDADGRQSSGLFFANVEGVVNPCAVINGQKGIFDSSLGDCNYFNVVSGPSGILVTENLDLGPLANGGVHKFSDSLLIGEDFSSDATLAIAGITQGGDGPSLNIAAGTTLTFLGSTNVLAIRRGAQINIGGSPNAPVIMTSQFDINNQRSVANGGTNFQSVESSGQWGGLAIHGFGVTNACAYTGAVSTANLAISGECHILSDDGSSFYGGLNNADSSGAINYLQVKHAGGFINGKSISPLALYGSGSGTTFSNVEVYSSDADGMQLIGGATNIQNYIGLYSRESGIGIDEGYQGSVSNALLIQPQSSGRDCVAVSGIVDASLLSAPQIEALITQGINSRVNLRNLTCVASGPFFETGRGVSFFDGAYGTLTDSIITAAGLDDQFSLNACVGSQGRSLQAIQDGDVSITSNIFACPDPSNGAVLPNTSPLETFLSSTGNQFATLPTGVITLPPIVGASNVLLEGSPLIYSVPQASLQVNGAPTSVSPTGTFIGAVQQGGNDWTLNWTFGLHPGSRLASVWFEGPLFGQNRFAVGSRGEIVTLDASNAVAVANPITFSWTQTQGTPGVISDPTISAPTFTVPGLGTPLTSPEEFFILELTAADANGAESKTSYFVQVNPPIPPDFYMTSKSVIPFQFNQTIEGGQKVEVRPDNTGTLIGATSVDFTWIDTNTTFTMDFTAAGGFNSGLIANLRDVNPARGLEIVQDSSQIDLIELTFTGVNFGEQLFDRRETGINQAFDITNSIALPDDVFSNRLVTSSTTSIVGSGNGFGLNFAGTTRTLPLNLTPSVTTLRNPSSLVLDELTFIDGSTGFARLKGQSFTYTEGFPFFTINFADGEQGRYSPVLSEGAGLAIGVEFTRQDSSVTATVDLSLENLAGFNWIAGSVPGIYPTNQRVELNDGSFVDTTLFFRLHPEGTGQVEMEVANLMTGAIEGIAVSDQGICWQLDVNGDLTIARTSAPDQRFTGSQLPSVSTCSLLNTAAPDNTLIDFSQTNRLFNTDNVGGYVTFVEDNFNQCNPSFAGCDPAVLELRDTFHRIFDPALFLNGNPPIAVPDDLTASSGLLSGSPVLANDLPGDSAIEPTSVTILIGPANGSASVDGPTGDILYTSNGGFSGTDLIYYRVLDVNGNESTIGVLTITVF